METINQKRALKNTLKHIQDKLKESEKPHKDFKPVNIEVKADLDKTVREISLYLNSGTCRVELQLLAKNVFAYRNGSKRALPLREGHNKQELETLNHLKEIYLQSAGDNGYKV